MKTLLCRLLLAVASLLSSALLVGVGSVKIPDAGTNIFWADAIQGKTQSADLKNPGRQGSVSGLSKPNGIAIDSVGGKIYWTDSGSHQIRCANLDGSGCETLVKWSYKPCGIAVDRNCGKI